MVNEEMILDFEITEEETEEEDQFTESEVIPENSIKLYMRQMGRIDMLTPEE